MEWLAEDPIHKGYFDEVRSEFEKLKAAYSLYPEGLVKEVVSKKNHPTEIIVTPYYSDPNVPCHGQYIYDESSDPVKVDQIYYTGQGDSTYYSHEIGHMITGSTGHSAFNDKWKVLFDESMLSAGGFVSDHAMSSHLEDIAETWAYLWHHTEDVRQQILDGDTLLQKKVQLLTEMLDEKLDSFDAAKVPWSDLLEA